MEKYDEDLYENPFFIAIQNQFSSLFDEVTKKRWTICVPRYSSVIKEDITEEDIKDHIISPDSEDGNEDYRTWSGQIVLVNEGKIELPNSQKKSRGVPILFEETFYNTDDESYRVICVGQMLNRDQKAEDKPLEKKTYNLYSYEECINRLFGHHGGKKTQDSLDRQLESFAGSYPRLASAKFINIVDAANAHFTKAMQTMLKDSHVRRSAQESESDMFDLKLAVELYMMHFLHRSMFQAITTNLSSEDAEINKMARSLVDIKLTDLGIRVEFNRVVKLTRKELRRLNSFSTPFGRLRCLKRVVDSLSSSATESKEATLVLTTDDFLPIMIYLIIKSEIPNWTANLMYMKHFHFSKCYQDDEYMFYLTTVEAALGYIKSGRLQQEALKSYSIKQQKDVKADLSRQTSGGALTDRFFQYVQSGDESAVRLLLGKPQESDPSLTLCHPLCDCAKCKSLLKQRPTEYNLVTAYTRDDRGYTALHIAALHGQAHLVDLLVQHGAVVDASDYLGLTPLHLACQKGYQNIILLLIHFGADCTVTDGVGNSPLHLCVDSGHEDCVKALVFTDKTRTKIDINVQNLRGDTPLHLAAKWGYESIIMILLENDADAKIRNRKKQLPVHLAQNSNVLKIFKAHDREPKLEIVRGNSESLDEYNVVKVSKPRPSSISIHSPRSPTLITPEVASLDQEEIRQVELLFRAIENQDIPLVYYYLKLNERGEEMEERSEPVDISAMCHPLCTCDKCSKLQQSSFTETPLHVNVTNKSGYTPLHKAAQTGNLDLVSVLVRRGANVNVTNHKRVMPLHIACYFAQTEICSFLLTHGADIDAKDMMGDTPLHLACYKSCDGIVDLLLKYCAKVNTTNMKGNAPLHNAVRVGSVNIINKLLDAGAYPLSKNKDGLTPFDFTKDPKLRDLLNSHITKKPLPRSLSDPVPLSNTATAPSPGRRSSPDRSPGPISIKDLFAAFEEKDLETLKSLALSIKSFDAKENLKKTQTKDLSSPNLKPLQHSLSIQKFDLSALRHVESTDKSDPMHIYSLTLKDSVQSFQDSGEDSTLPDVISLSSDETGDVSTKMEEDWVLPDVVGHAPSFRKESLDTTTEGRHVDRTRLSSNKELTEEMRDDDLFREEIGS